MRALGRRLNKPLLILTVLITAYVARWITWRNGRVLATSESPFSYVKTEVRIRCIPASANFWAVPLSFVAADSPRYRFEFYKAGSSMLWSAQTFADESYGTQKTRIEWNAPGVASVYLDEMKVLVCDQYGNWTKPQ